MASKWPVHKVMALQERGVLLVEDGNHGEYRPRTEEFGSGDYAFIRAADMDSGRVLFASAERVNATAMARMRKGIGKGGDVLFSHKGTVGKMAFAPLDAPPFVCSPQTTFWRTLDESVLDRRFLYFYMHAAEFTDQWHARKAETDMADYVSLTAQRELSIALPPLPEQRAIAGVLGALDDKIEVNRKTARVLEGIARAVFTSWFVDFDPVRRKAAGEPTGLPDEIAALFPDRLVDSPIGEVPEGWRVEPMSELFDAIRGLSYKGSGLADSGMPMHNLNSVYEGGGYKYPGIKFYSGEYRDRHMLDAGDVIVANTEQGHDHLLIGYPAIVPKRFGDKGLFSHHLYRVRSKAGSPLTARYIYQAMMTPRLRDEIIGHTNGTTVNMLSISGLEMSRVVVPPAKLVQKFDALAKAILDRIELMHDANPTLAALRDALLPKLISGELRIADAEKIVGRATHG